MKLIISILIIGSLFLYSCSVDTNNEPNEPPRVKVEEANAYIYKLPDESSCEFAIQYNTTYLPSNLPDSMKVDGLDVVITFEYTSEKETCTYDDGTTVESTDFEIIEIL